MWPAAAVLLGVIAWACLDHAWKCWSSRHIPGPCGFPIVGCLPYIIRCGLHEYSACCYKKYGPVFKWFFGPTMWLVLADPDLARKANMRLIDRSTGRQFNAGDKKEDDPLSGLAAAKKANMRLIHRNIGTQFTAGQKKEDEPEAGLIAAKGDMWRGLRAAWQPAFHSSSLQQYGALMDQCAVRLGRKLQGAADSGEVVDIYGELGNMTMEVVGTTAFGTDFKALDPNGTQSELVWASRTVFSSGALSRSSWYVILALVLPLLRTPLEWMASRWPDRRLKVVQKARDILRTTSLGLINAWKQEHAAAKATPAGTPSASAVAAAAEGTVDEDGAAADAHGAHGTGNGAAHAGANGTAHATANDTSSGMEHSKVSGEVDITASGTAIGAAPVKSGRATGVKAGSFLELFLGERERTKDLKLNDYQVVAQANTFILAGYDTTANTLAYAIHSISANPEVQERLLQEVDAFGRGRPVTADDMDQFIYITAIVQEALRLYPPATMTSRKVPDTPGGMQLGPNLHLKPGQVVASAMYAFQRSEQYWPRASEFLPQRFLPEAPELAASTEAAWMPFGAGPRMCIGWRFALQEAKTALVRLYQSYTFELEPGQVPLQVTQALTLNPAKGVHVRVKPRNAPPLA